MEAFASSTIELDGRALFCGRHAHLRLESLTLESMLDVNIIVRAWRIPLVGDGTYVRRQHYCESVVHAPGTTLTVHVRGGRTQLTLLSVCWTRPLMWLSLALVT